MFEIASELPVLVQAAGAGDGFSPADLTAALAGGAGTILGFIAVGVTAGVGIMLAMIGINRGLGSFNKTAKKG